MTSRAPVMTSSAVSRASEDADARPFRVQATMTGRARAQKGRPHKKCGVEEEEMAVLLEASFQGSLNPERLKIDAGFWPDRNTAFQAVY